MVDPGGFTIQPDPEFPPIQQAGEREMLDGMLDYYRACVAVKVAGLDEPLAHRRLGPSATTVAGLVKHLALVEDSWFTNRVAGHPEPEPWASAPDGDPDWEFNSAGDDRLIDLVELYRAACERSRAITTGLSLDIVTALPGPRQWTLRYVLVHLIEETARHLGHLDILRELLDGTIGEP